jgi:hypothetical protein
LAIESAYLVSSSDNIQLEEVASFPDDAFKPFHKDLRLGFVDNPVWVKLRIKPQPTTSAEAASVIGSDSAVVLRTGLLALDSIELYEQVDGEWVKQHRGDKVKQKYKSCQDDFHCFELRSDPKLPIDLYLKIQTTTITTVVLEAVTVRDLPALVANRMVTLVSTLAVATSLLVIGLLFFVIERSSLSNICGVVDFVEYWFGGQSVCGGFARIDQYSESIPSEYSRHIQCASRLCFIATV